MTRKISLPVIFTFLIAALLVNPSAYAEEKELPLSGTLSTSGSLGSKGRSVDGVWGQDNVYDGGGAPISGSVSKVGRGQWMMRIYNNTEDTYSVDLEVVQVDRSGGRIKSDFYSYTLRGGQSAERSIKGRTNTEQCKLKLTNWKNLTAKKKKS